MARTQDPAPTDADTERRGRGRGRGAIGRVGRAVLGNTHFCASRSSGDPLASHGTKRNIEAQVVLGKGHRRKPSNKSARRKLTCSGQRSVRPALRGQTISQDVRRIPGLQTAQKSDRPRAVRDAAIVFKDPHQLVRGPRTRDSNRAGEAFPTSDPSLEGNVHLARRRVRQRESEPEGKQAVHMSRPPVHRRNGEVEPESQLAERATKVGRAMPLTASPR